MIRIVLAQPTQVEAEGILRSVSSGLEADTPFSRELGIGAGPGVLERLRAMGDLPVGAAVITPAGELSAGFLIHAVLQSTDQPVTPKAVRLALQNGLRRAEEWGMETLAVPPLGTGAGNMDTEEVAAVMIPLITDHLTKAQNPREVLLVVGTDYEKDVFSRSVELTEGTVSGPES